ncbi:MAG: phosphatase PAP2 family protein [Spirochaetaceae bacterium]|jgi:membrane-associated phospholipid phosphatase|nr:phosphatase PAP2 family protein [Spirochaetaceae bacterium]
MNTVIITATEAPIPLLYRVGLAIIKAIQTKETESLTALMHGITHLGDGYVYLAVIMLLFWCIDEKRGLHLGIVILFSAWTNAFCKVLCMQPRPYQLDPSVGRAFESTYGLPSGHAQLAATFGLSLALWLRRRFIWLGAVLMILLISLSRLYLGLHFPTDLLAGWVIAGCIFTLDLRFARRISALLRTSLRAQVLAVAVIALTMNALYPADKRLSAVFFGFGTGYALMLKHIHFCAGSKKRFLPRCLRALIGLSGAALLFAGLAPLLPAASSSYYELSNFLHYALLGLWVTAGAPFLFMRLNLAEAEV